MSRRRSQNPTRAISITLPSTLLEEIDDKLTRTQSRSAYIANAVRAYMDEQTLATIASNEYSTACCSVQPWIHDQDRNGPHHRSAGSLSSPATYGHFHRRL